MVLRRRSALVLGGGGISGASWELGVLVGLQRGGCGIAADADRLIGTSAGASVAVQLDPSANLENLLCRQIDPRHQPTEQVPSPGSVKALNEALAQGLTMAEWNQRSGCHEQRWDKQVILMRHHAIADRINVTAWPQRDVSVIAVRADTGMAAVFDPKSAVPVVTAVEASCAVPGLWPPVGINGTNYVDGGARTSANADLAIGYDIVVIIAPAPDAQLERQIDLLRGNGMQVESITPEDRVASYMQKNPFDPNSRTRSGRAGVAIGHRLAKRIKRLL